MSDVVNIDFPVWALLPKKETGVTQFLTKYPTYDGRGVVIAIFDSGVDPGVPGLTETPDGKVKVIERYDCSGAGDVNTSTIVKAENGIITGVTGRKISVPSTWKNPSGDYHVGVKKAFELYPAKLQERIAKERKEKLWDPQHKTSLAASTRRLQEFETKNSENSLTGVEKLTKENIEAEVDVLSNLEKKLIDQGPAYDCIVFHDGTCWRACIDTSEEGDVSGLPVLGEYSITHDHAILTQQDQLNYSVNVYDNGNVLEIVSMCSPHGTHVASIAAGYFPDDPQKNGVAPGAQIISLTVGDNRLQAMETGSALVRAMIKIMQLSTKYPVHVINMSYGEHAHWSCSGRLGELMSEVVVKYGVTWVCSAGNHGPALSTIGTPPDISTDCIIGVGAYVSPDMMAAEYTMRELLPGMPYTWSSRGPTIDGGNGVSICAPGAAITSVPSFTLRKTQLMNGTSMAAPHVAGAVAVLLSGLIQKGLKFSPHSVKRALENTAQFQPGLDPFAQGHGLLKVESAFDHLVNYNNVIERDVQFIVQCGNNNSKGIHLRNGLLQKPKDCQITVSPIFHEQAEKKEMLDFNMRLSLVCSQPWVQCGPYLELSNVPRVFSLRISPAGMPEGVHSTSIRAYDTENVDKGAVFEIPVTAVKPTEISPENPGLVFSNISFKPNTIRRHFILVPDLATWVVLRLRCSEKDKSGKFVVHCVQLRPKQVCKALEFYKMFTISSSADVVHSFPCRGGLILEVTVAKYWGSLGDMDVDYQVEFRGAKPDSQTVTMQGADGIFTIDMYSGLKTEEIAPAVSLKNCVVVVRPSESKVTPCCSQRDVVPPTRQIYENILSYNFHLNKPTEITPSCPILSDLLYESEFESQLWMLYDSNKQLVCVGDAYPAKYSVKVEKGDYVLKLNVRHERRELLEKLSDTPLLLSQKLCQPISLDVYLSQAQAMIQGKKLAGAIMPPGHHILPIYIGPLNNDKSTKNLPFGHYLQGTITYAKDEIGKKADVYQFKYVMPEPVKKNKCDNNKDKDKDKTKLEEFNDAVRDLKISWLGKLEYGDDAKKLYEELCKDYPDNLQVHTAMLTCLDPIDVKRVGVLPFIGNPALDDKKEPELKKSWETVISIADSVISAVDSTLLLSVIGLKSDVRPDATKVKQQAEKQKTALVEALARKGCALARTLAVNLVGTPASESDLEPVHAIWREIVKFVDPNDLKVIYFMIWHAILCQQYGRSLRFLAKLSEEKGIKEVDEKTAEIYRILEWTHAEKLNKTLIPIKYPSTYRRF